MDEEDEFENYVDDYEEEAPQRTTAARSSRNTAKESSEEKGKMGGFQERSSRHSRSSKRNRAGERKYMKRSRKNPLIF